MRILIFAQSLSVGGAERVAALWATGFVAQGHEVRFALMADETVPNTYQIPDCVSVVYANSKLKGKIRNYIARFNKTGEIIKNFKPNLIIVVLHVQDIPIWFFTRCTKIKIIQTEHNVFERPDYAPMTWRNKFLKFYRNRLFDAVTVLSQADKDYIGDRLKYVYVLPNPLAFDPVSEIPNKDKIILAVGRLDVWFCKGFDLLIEAFRRIHKQFPEWRLRIVGSGKDASLMELKEMAMQNEVFNYVEFIPFTGNIQKHYKDAEVFCLSSRYEGFGMVLIEAMSQGCACVACDYYGRQKEILIDKKYGLVCEANNLESLVDALTTILNEKEYREEVINNSIHRATDYSLDKIMRHWDNIISHVQNVKETAN